MSSFTERSQTFSCPDFSGGESKDEHDVKPEPDRSRRWREASLWWLLELNAVQLDLLKVSVETHNTTYYLLLILHQFLKAVLSQEQTSEMETTREL